MDKQFQVRVEYSVADSRVKVWRRDGGGPFEPVADRDRFREDCGPYVPRP